MILPNVFSIAVTYMTSSWHAMVAMLSLYWCVFFATLPCCLAIVAVTFFVFGRKECAVKIQFSEPRQSWMSAMVMKASHVLWETGRTQSCVCAQVMQVFLNLGVHCLFFCSSCCWFVYNNLNVMTSWLFFLVALFCEPSLGWQDIQFELITSLMGWNQKPVGPCWLKGENGRNCPFPKIACFINIYLCIIPCLLRWYSRDNACLLSCLADLKKKIIGSRLVKHLII